MLQTLTPSEIKARVKAINWSLSRLASTAKLTVSTVCRGPQRIGTNRRAVESLEAEELRIMRHTMALHPAEALAALCPERKSP